MTDPAMSPPPGRSGRRWWTLLVVLLIALAAAAAFFLLRDDGTSEGGRGATPNATASRVAQFSGSSGTTTGTFSGALNWELRWTAASGSGFRVELLKPDGTSRGTLVTAGRKTSGSTFVAEAGTFKLKVTSKKPWTIEVYSRPS